MKNMPKVPSLKQLKPICQPQSITKRGVERWYGPFYRKIDLRVTWFLLHFKGITANMITIPNLFIAGLGGWVLLIPKWWCVVLYFLVFQIWVILDGVDGEIARYNKEKGFWGPALDILGHFFIYFNLFLPLGFKLYFESHNSLFLILSFLAGIFSNWMQLPEISKNIILYKNKFEFSSSSLEPTSSLPIKIYRIIIGPMEISIFVIFLWLLTSYKFPNLSLISWKIFLIFYLIIFFLSFLANIFKMKKELSRYQF